ncbi:D-alanine--D-alanine ligase [Lysinibacillus xylanilyticus]|uniref:D-alanine--D-alanine ligase n=1 Tax=Lysinibacillus xylanilyticus TaxID=582475 RepID=A0A0K9F502_9BACI|nr:D-alanine--D-serine ligase VanG [Lysinibacillus xylanilyticus]KMY29674.1 D-alanine--D-alanine ligase [Lysinibacillus xylanilyticus]
MKPNIAVIFGGNSSEYPVSLQCAFSILENLDARKYTIIPIGITRQGDWYRYDGKFDNILNDSWIIDTDNLTPIIISQNCSVGGIVALSEEGINVTKLDFVLPLLHGKNGEDGTVQGLFELAGIQIIGCDTLSSALCMDKDRAHKLVQAAGIAAPKAITLRKSKMQEALSLSKDLAYPLFIKPVRAGSSFGISKIYEQSELQAAVDLAFEHDCEVIIEEAVEGFEVGCAVLGIDDLLVGRVDEIELSNGFFDYTEKYSLKTSKIHMPARIDEICEKRIQETAKTIYQILGCSGFARVDMFLTPSGEIVFNEVNTIPGFTSHSRYPNMMKGIGLSYSEILDKLIGLYTVK